MPFRRIDPSRSSPALSRAPQTLSEEMVRSLSVRQRVQKAQSHAEPRTVSAVSENSAQKGSGRRGPNWDAAGNYKVGKGKPPVHSRFPPGRSGNPKGRKPGSRGTVAQAKQILGEKMPVKMRGKTRKLDAFGIALSVALDKAAKGDLKAIDLILRHYREVFPESPAEVEEVLGREDQALIDAILASAGFKGGPVVRQKRLRTNAELKDMIDEEDDHEEAAS